MKSNKSHLQKNYIEDEIKSLEKKYVSFAKESFHTEKAMEIRDRLIRSYENSVLNNLDTFATEFELKVWKLCFYSPISELREKIQNISNSFQKCSSGAIRDKVIQGEIFKCSNQLKVFLESSIGFYRSFLEKLKIKYRLILDRPIPSKVNQNSREYFAYHFCARILNSLGDLARYNHELYIYPQENWQIAWVSYMNSQLLYPYSGNSFNQMAVLSDYSYDIMSCLYYYARSIAVNEPSLNGTKNLEILIKSNKISHYLHDRKLYFLECQKRREMDGDAVKSKVFDKNSDNIQISALRHNPNFQLDLFFSGICGFFTVLGKIPLQYEVLNSLLNDFDLLLETEKFQNFESSPVYILPIGPVCLIQLIAWVAYNFHGLHKVFPSPDKIYEPLVQLALGLLASLCKKLNKYLKEVAFDQSNSVDSDRCLNLNDSSEFFFSKGNIPDLLTVVSLFVSWIQHNLIPDYIKMYLSNKEYEKIYKMLKSEFQGILFYIIPEAKKYRRYVRPYYNILYRRDDNSSITQMILPPLPEQLELNGYLPFEKVFNEIRFDLQSIAYNANEAIWRRCDLIACFAEKMIDLDLKQGSYNGVKDNVNHEPFISSNLKEILKKELGEPLDQYRSFSRNEKYNYHDLQSNEVQSNVDTVGIFNDSRIKKSNNKQYRNECYVEGQNKYNSNKINICNDSNELQCNKYEISLDSIRRLSINQKNDNQNMDPNSDSNEKKISEKAWKNKLSENNSYTPKGEKQKKIAKNQVKPTLVTRIFSQNKILKPDSIPTTSEQNDQDTLSLDIERIFDGNRDGTELFEKSDNLNKNMDSSVIMNEPRHNFNSIELSGGNSISPPGITPEIPLSPQIYTDRQKGFNDLFDSQKFYVVNDDRKNANISSDISERDEQDIRSIFCTPSYYNNKNDSNYISPDRHYSDEKCPFLFRGLPGYKQAQPNSSGCYENLIENGNIQQQNSKTNPNVQIDILNHLQHVPYLDPLNNVSKNNSFNKDNLNHIFHY